MRKAVSVEECLAITLCYLAGTSEYRTLSHLFGVSKATICLVVKDTCQAIISILGKEYISFPVGDQLMAVVEGFKSRWDLPQCAGAIDGSHIPIMPPANNHTDYYNRKGWYSMLVQGVVDHQYLFRDICIGWLGSVHDARVFINSGFYKKCINGEVLHGNEIILLGKNWK